MGNLIVKVIINAIAVVVAVIVAKQWISFPAVDGLMKLQGDWWQVLVVALILALINSYLKPILKMLSFPITLLTMGLFAFILNAALLLLVAFIADMVKIDFTIGGFPPDFTLNTVIGAIVGSIIISLVSIVLGMVNSGRRIIT